MKGKMHGFGNIRITHHPLIHPPDSIIRIFNPPADYLMLNKTLLNAKLYKPL